MSNPLTKNSDTKSLKKRFLELTASGYIESVALKELDLSRGRFIQMYMDDPDFSIQIEEARKARADIWVSKIVEDLDVEYSKDEIPNQRLRFDKLQFLAKADDPNRFGNNSKKLDISIDLKQFKLLPPDQALAALAADPFAPKIIEAEFTEQEEDLL
jgi:hypothetical protein